MSMPKYQYQGVPMLELQNFELVCLGLTKVNIKLQVTLERFKVSNIS